MEIRSDLNSLLHAKREDSVTEGDDLIEVSPATQRIAFAYERFRNTLEPDEEDILRRNALYRVLERRLQEGRPPTVMAEQILQELIRANYIPPVTRAFAETLATRLVRTQQLTADLPPELYKWFLHIVAVSIDRDLYPRNKEESLIQLMYQDVARRVQWMGRFVEEEDRATQLYIACHRALFKADDDEIIYDYFTRHFPQWNVPREWTDKDVTELQHGIPGFYAEISKGVAHADRERLTRLLKPAAVPYRILHAIMGDEQAFSSPESLEQAVRAAVAQKSRRIRGRMNRRAWNSIMFLFLTKTILAFLIEVPYEVYLLKQFHGSALAVNIFFHPLLLLTLATTKRMPGTRNTERILEEVGIIATGEGTAPTIVLRAARRYGAVTWTILALFYSFFFLGMFWLLFLFLEFLQFSLVAMFMFVLFLGLVSFLAIRIRGSVTEISMVRQNEGVLTSLASFLSLPILEFGRWVALHVKEINIPLIFMDRVLEAPFKILVDVIEEWFTFVRERREEIE